MALSKEDKRREGGEETETVEGKIQEEDTEQNKAAISVAQLRGRRRARDTGERGRAELSAEQQHSSVASVLKVDVHHDCWTR